jgi:hypothetical protein
MKEQKNFNHLQPIFDNYKQQSTFTKVLEERITQHKTALDRVILDRTLKSLPTVGRDILLEDLGMDLFSAGLPNDAVENVHFKNQEII